MICLKCDRPLQIIKVLLNKLFCKNCGYPLGKEQPALGCTIQEHQDYLLCLNCRVCPQRHAMIKPKSLSAFKSVLNLYTQNQFICNFCHAKKDNIKQDTIHCLSCGFDICGICQEKYFLIKN